MLHRIIALSLMLLSWNALAGSSHPEGFSYKYELAVFKKDATGNHNQIQNWNGKWENVRCESTLIREFQPENEKFKISIVMDYRCDDKPGVVIAAYKVINVDEDNPSATVYLEPGKGGELIFMAPPYSAAISLIIEKSS